MVHGKRSEREVEGSVKFSFTDPVTYSVPSIAKLTRLFLKFTAYQFQTDTLQPQTLKDFTFALQIMGINEEENNFHK